jgi:hypothetical protein
MGCVRVFWSIKDPPGEQGVSNISVTERTLSSPLSIHPAAIPLCSCSSREFCFDSSSTPTVLLISGIRRLDPATTWTSTDEPRASYRWL